LRLLLGFLGTSARTRTLALSVRRAPFTGRMDPPQRERDPAIEREEIQAFVEERPEYNEAPKFNDALGRIPDGPGRGWRRRERLAKSCETCEGDLWIEADDGIAIPCECKSRRTAQRASYRLRAGGWWQGTSLSFAAPPLATVPTSLRNAVERLCADVKGNRDTQGIWIVGGPGLGKSALCAYFGQRLYPSNDAVVEHMGDLLAHLRWLGATKGELAVEQRMAALAETPLLVLDNIDRAVRTNPPATALGMRESCASQDLIRLATLLRDRREAMRPVVVTSRSNPADCAARAASISRLDLVRGLLITAAGLTSPFEDFPRYSEDLLVSATRELQSGCAAYELDSFQEDAVAA
jgi:hypothetical protein